MARVNPTLFLTRSTRKTFPLQGLLRGMIVDYWIWHLIVHLKLGSSIRSPPMLNFNLEETTKTQRGSRALTSALVGVGVQRQAPVALPPVKTRYPLHRRLGEPQGWSGLMRKNLAPTRIRSPDRPARSESLFRPTARRLIHLKCEDLFYNFPYRSPDTMWYY